MAKHQQEIRGEKGKLHFRVVEFDLEGGNDSLQESLRTVAAALAKFQNGAVAATKPALGARVFERTATPTDDIQQDESPVVEAVADSEELDEPYVESVKKKRSYPSPEVVELEMKNGAPSFEEYSATYDTTVARSKYLVALGFLKEHSAHVEANQNHVFTLFKLMRWSYLPDFTQPLRSLKTSQFVTSPGGRGTFTINHVGENELQKLKNK